MTRAKCRIGGSGMDLRSKARVGQQMGGDVRREEAEEKRCSSKKEQSSKENKPGRRELNGRDAAAAPVKRQGGEHAEGEGCSSNTSEGEGSEGEALDEEGGSAGLGGRRRRGLCREKTGKCLKESDKQQPHQKAISSVSKSADWSHFLTDSLDKTAKILHEEIGSVKGHFGPINALAFNLNGWRYSNIFVTAPSLENLKTLFDFVCKGIDVLEYKVDAYCNLGDVLKAQGLYTEAFISSLATRGAGGGLRG
ncbi:hypothetical protein ABZP36_007272 [Zizania latifolia]